MPRRLTEKEREQVRALTRKVPREGGGEWVMPTTASVALEREFSGKAQQSRERVGKMKADSQPKDQGGPKTMATKATATKVTKVTKKSVRKNGKGTVQHKATKLRKAFTGYAPGQHPEGWRVWGTTAWLKHRHADKIASLTDDGDTWTLKMKPTFSKKGPLTGTHAEIRDAFLKLVRDAKASTKPADKPKRAAAKKAVKRTKRAARGRR